MNQGHLNLSNDEKKNTAENGCDILWQIAFIFIAEMNKHVSHVFERINAYRIERKCISQDCFLCNLNDMPYSTVQHYSSMTNMV